MKFTIRYKDMDKPLALEDYISKKLTKLEKFSWLNDEIRIEVKKYAKENDYKTTLQATTKNANPMIAEAKHENLNSSFDLALEKLNTQITKYKDTHFTH
ncbi:MAG: ribosome hibernation-promoting factor, HPF/YfiA family [Mycoplasma sp.]